MVEKKKKQKDINEDIIKTMGRIIDELMEHSTTVSNANLNLFRRFKVQKNLNYFLIMLTLTLIIINFLLMLN